MVFDRRTAGPVLVFGLVLNVGLILFIWWDDQTDNSQIWDLFLTHRGRAVSPWSWGWLAVVMSIAVVVGVVARKCRACGGFWALHPTGETGWLNGRQREEWECRKCGHREWKAPRHRHRRAADGDRA